MHFEKREVRLAPGATGAIVAIAVVIVIVSVISLCCVLRRRKAKKLAVSDAEASPTGVRTPTLTSAKKQTASFVAKSKAHSTDSYALGGISTLGATGGDSYTAPACSTGAMDFGSSGGDCGMSGGDCGGGGGDCGGC
ncbi:MAG: hypothetical protein Q9218_001128 [Villophora microphyllina]